LNRNPKLAARVERAGAHPRPRGSTADGAHVRNSLIRVVESDTKGTRAEDALLEVREEGGGVNCRRESPVAENPEESALTKHRSTAALDGNDRAFFFFLNPL